MEISHSFSQYSCGGGGGMVRISARSVMGMAYVCSSCQSVSYSRCDAVFDIAADRAMRSLSTKVRCCFCNHRHVSAFRGGWVSQAIFSHTALLVFGHENMFYFTLRSCVCNLCIVRFKADHSARIVEDVENGKGKKKHNFFFFFKVA